MADGPAAMLENIGHAVTRPPKDRFRRNLGSRIPSCPRHVRHYAVVMVTALPSNYALTRGCSRSLKTASFQGPKYLKMSTTHKRDDGGAEGPVRDTEARSAGVPRKGRV